MKDPVSQDVLLAAGKAAPPIVGAITTAAQGLEWADWVAISTLVYTCVLTATTVMKNWGDWQAWAKGRWSDLLRLWGWVRGRRA